jgi:CheY-like chemotaxis protein
LSRSTPSLFIAKESEIKSAASSHLPGEHRMQGLSRPVILCIDDRENKTALELFKRVLETSGYTAFTAGNAHEALEIFHNNPVDLVLTEHIVPTTNGGPPLSASMKRLKPDVPVAIYTADLAESPEEMQFADTFITKLVSIDELLSTIKKLLTRRPTRVTT